MNSLSDILNDHAKDIFGDDGAQPPNDPTAEPTPPTENIAAAHPAASPSPLTAETVAQVEYLIQSIREQLGVVTSLLAGQNPRIPQAVYAPVATAAASLPSADGSRIIEGTFNGQKMLGVDGHEYHVPPNYASKSKLVEGDGMKLTITANGSFIYKQITQIPRRRVVGELVFDTATGQWSVLAEGRTYKILTASATFYRGSSGDEVVSLIPDQGPAEWGAVENIIHK